MWILRNVCYLPHINLIFWVYFRVPFLVYYRLLFITLFILLFFFVSEVFTENCLQIFSGTSIFTFPKNHSYQRDNKNYCCKIAFLGWYTKSRNPADESPVMLSEINLFQHSVAFRIETSQWIALQIKWLVSIWSAKLGWNELVN